MKTGEKTQLIIETGVQSYQYPSPGADLFVGFCSSCDLFTYHLFTQFVCEITKGETMEEIWSCVNCLFFIYFSLIYGKKQHIKHGIVWSKYLKAVVGLEMSGVKGAWFKVSNKTKGPPAKSCLQN